MNINELGSTSPNISTHQPGYFEWLVARHRRLLPPAYASSKGALLGWLPPGVRCIAKRGPERMGEIERPRGPANRTKPRDR